MWLYGGRGMICLCAFVSLRHVSLSATPKQSQCTVRRDGSTNGRGKKSLVWLVAAGQIGPLMMLRDKPLDTFHLSRGVKALRWTKVFTRTSFRTSCLRPCAIGFVCLARSSTDSSRPWQTWMPRTCDGLPLMLSHLSKPEVSRPTVFFKPTSSHLIREPLTAGGFKQAREPDMTTHMHTHCPTGEWDRPLPKLQ